MPPARFLQASRIDKVMNNILKTIDKSKLLKLLGQAGAVGLAGALAYLIPHLTADVVGPVLAAPIVVALGFALTALKKHLPADVETPVVGSLKAQSLRNLERIEALDVGLQTGKVVQAVADHLDPSSEEPRWMTEEDFEEEMRMLDERTAKEGK